jgi:acyl carrier protein
MMRTSEGVTLGVGLSEREVRVAEEIVRIAREDLGIEATRALEPLAAALDSLALLSLVVAVEDRFRIVLTDDDAAGTRTLDDLARLVAARAAPESLP